MMKLNQKRFKGGDERGVAIYIAVTITAALVLVSFAIISLALKQIAISSASRDSEDAFYAADSGSECAIFWDIKNPGHPGTSAFATTTGDPVGWHTISCNADANNPSNSGILVGAGGNNATSTFNLTFLPKSYCATVTVVKGYNNGTQTTKIESRGYNTCDLSARQRVERAVRITY